MSIRTISSILLLSFLFIILLIIMMSRADAAFIDSMIPELIGFCFEGIFFIGLFTLWQHRKESHYKRQLFRNLRGFLGIFLRALNSGINCSTFNPINNPEELNHSGQGIQKLAANIGNCSMSEAVIHALHQLSNDNISSLEALLPVAAQLSGAHMTHWNNILNQVKKLGKSQCRDDSQKIVLQLLNQIEHFDNQVIKI